MIILTLFSALNSHSEDAYKALLNESDYFRACGEYKRYKFQQGISDTAEYYLSTASIYALSKHNEISLNILDKAFTYINSDEQMMSDALIRSYIAFTEGSFSEAIFEYEDFSGENDTLKSSLVLIKGLVLKDTIPSYSYLPDNIKKEIDIYKRIDLKNPLFAFSLSIFPGLGEAYAGYYLSAARDFMITNSMTAIMILAFLKNKNSFSIDKIEFTSDYFKSRDYVLTYLIYSSLVQRFQNGSKTNAEFAAEKYNSELYKKYLTPLHAYIDSIFRIKLKEIVK